MRILPIILFIAVFWHSTLLAQQGGAFRGIKNIHSERRIALVIGNGSYKSSPLRNPCNDAKDISIALKQKNFNVNLLLNAKKHSIIKAIRKFGRDLRDGGVGLFYYAGHGMQVKGRNYLIPIGGNIQAEHEVPLESVDINRVLGYMENSKNRLNIVILDACRDNPFARSFRSSARGLSQIDSPTGTLIAYATAPGKTAADGIGRNGLYTKHILMQLKNKDLEISQFFRLVRSGVRKDTGSQQIPWESTSIEGDFYFTPRYLKNSHASIQEQLQPDFEMWSLIKKSKNINDFKTFISLFPQSAYVPISRMKIKAILERNTKNKIIHKWKDLYYKASDGNFNSDSEWLGLRTLYNNLLNPKKFIHRVTKFSGISPFVSGPHINGELNLNSNEFGFYNIEFVKWINIFILSIEDEEHPKQYIKKLYDLYLIEPARIFYLTYLKVHSRPDLFLRAKKNYKNHESFKYGLENYFAGINFRSNVWEDYLNNDSWVLDSACSFWIRRSIDRTDNEFFKGLDFLIQQYDPIFYQLVTSKIKVISSTPEWIKKGIDDNGYFSPKVLTAAIKNGFKNLKYADLRFVALSGIEDLSGSNLEYANLSNKSIYGVNFNRAKLQGACLRHLHTNDSTFHYADLRGADIRGLNYYSCEKNSIKYFIGANLNGVIFNKGSRCQMPVTKQ